MGYYSDRTVEMNTRQFALSDRSYPTRLDTLHYYLEDFTDKLAVINELRPRNPAQQGYAECLHADFAARYYENPGTVQELVSAIHEVEGLICEQAGEQMTVVGVLPLAQLSLFALEKGLTCR